LKKDNEILADSDETFGFRKVASRDGKLFLNNRPLNLRGALDCAIFPVTGHPPVELAPWRKIMTTLQDYGLNHLRFHSWCPPEEAFIAADEVGIYLQPEVSTWSHNNSVLGDGKPLDEWGQRETQRMIDEYGNHPSFLLFCHSNEPHGNNHKKWLQDWVAQWREKDDRHLYTTGAGWPVMPGSDFNLIPQPRLQRWGEGLKSILNSQPPSTDFDFSQYTDRYPATPVVAHESGQWCAYPDFDLLEKFDKLDPFFQAKNYEIFKALAEENGLLDKADAYLQASGTHQVRAYKHDIETALRTKDLAGFQLLGLQDFSGQGTALVGVVDFFWDPKPYLTVGDDPDHPLLQGFSPIFWNTTYTTWQPPHTLRLLMDPENPALGG
jgi:hypothetical protein